MGIATRVMYSACEVAPEAEAAQEVAPAAALRFWIDWASEALATLALVTMETTPAALAMAVEFALPDEEEEVEEPPGTEPAEALWDGQFLGRTCVGVEDTNLAESPLLKAVDTTRALLAEMVALLVDGPPEVDWEVDWVVTFAGALGLIAVN